MNNILLKKYKEQKNIRRKKNIISGYKKIIIGTDADLDGTHITSLLLCFLKNFTPELLENTARLNTPVAVSISNKKIIDYVYSLDDISRLKGEIKYMKGLGGWTKESLNQIIEKDGFENMLENFNYIPNIDDETILDWFKASRTDIRKEKIRDCEFDLIKI